MATPRSDATTTSRGSPETDREALIALYNVGARGRIAQIHLTNENWLEDVPIGQWGGVTTNDDGRVTGLALDELDGEIPPELGNLDRLEILGIGGSDLSGEIPPELGNLANLQYLYLNDNDLSGAIPPELGNLSNLIRLTLQRNDLTGAIPPELGNLSNLEILTLSSNELRGDIPAGARQPL